MSETAFSLPLITVRKRCPTHGTEWDGPSFLSLNPAESARGYRLWPCDSCILQDEAERRLITGHAPGHPPAPIRRQHMHAPEPVTPTPEKSAVARYLETPPRPDLKLLASGREPGED